jgi:hypothetical protein
VSKRNNSEIINGLKKDITDVEVSTKSSTTYGKKELELEYLTKGSLLEKNFRENNSQKKNLF